MRETYDPMDEELDLTHDEKLRTTAIMMAIRFCSETIVKDGGLYKAMVKNDQTFNPATEDWLVRVAIKFCHYIKNGEIVEFVKEEETNDTDRPAQDQAGSAEVPIEPG